MEVAAWEFVAVATVCFAIAGAALYAGKIPGLIWLDRFIVRREYEPRQFGCAVAAVAAFGMFLIYAVISTR